MQVELSLEAAPRGRTGGGATAHVRTDGENAARSSGPARQFRCHSQSRRDPKEHAFGGLNQFVLVPGGRLRDTHLCRELFLCEPAGSPRRAVSSIKSPRRRRSVVSLSYLLIWP